MFDLIIWFLSLRSGSALRIIQVRNIDTCNNVLIVLYYITVPIMAKVNRYRVLLLFKEPYLLLRLEYCLNRRYRKSDIIIYWRMVLEYWTFLGRW